MARYAAAYRTTTAATALLPMASIYATAGINTGCVVEVGISNTTATAVNVALVRLTTAGTSTAVVGVNEDDSTQTAIMTPRNSHSSTGPTISGVPLREFDLGAAIGSGIIWTFGTGRHSGLTVPSGTGNGLGLYTPNGTGQVCSVYWVWDE
jgi:hypothetical protein